ncbi:MAG: 7-carboxy-7-deazaguanine synthase QueE [Sideroxydans sp.]|nr:7-carboxy-7-deazaguanine synthase QueE [Sideroxydans sp.]
MSQLADESLRISEIFFSLQGETSRVGLPTVFVRLTGCPLRCTYCDTAYAFTGGQAMTLQAILDEVALYGARFVTVTGGEPLAQKNVHLLMKALCDSGYEVSLETGGMMDVSGVDPRVMKVLDIKTPASGEMQKNLWSNIEFLNAHDEIKFVICDESDYEWAKKALVEQKLAKRCSVLFSPAQGMFSPKEIAERILRDRLSVRMQVQLHKLIWGNEAGH